MSKASPDHVFMRRLCAGTMFAGLLILTGCQTPEQERYADQDTCAGMGARYGSSSHTGCMLQQQQRRDDAQLRTLESARLSQIMAEDARRQHERMRRERQRD
ncbi:hypothetical protein GAO09_07270 [Rhizobiales bacterium RZME27]|uniref:Lipoprotein n=1 Tax=Endobacterium cereale TaxID=2663029 RepID=A0A6A8A7P4_9HYPH|nr:hypothetical protein [Endobacterium cereale]